MPAIFLKRVVAAPARPNPFFTPNANPRPEINPQVDRAQVARNVDDSSSSTTYTVSETYVATESKRDDLKSDPKSCIVIYAPANAGASLVSAVLAANLIKTAFKRAS